VCYDFLMVRRTAIHTRFEEVIMAAFNVRNFLEQKRIARRRRFVCWYAVFTATAIAVLCVVWEVSDKSCERVVPWAGPGPAVHCKLDKEGTLDPDGRSSLRPALEPRPGK